MIRLTVSHREIRKNNKFHSFSGQKEGNIQFYSFEDNKYYIQKRIVILLNKK